MIMLPPFPGRTAVNIDTALACTFPPRNLFSANVEVYIFPIFYLGPPHPTPHTPWISKLQQMIAPQGHMFLIEFPHSVNLVRDVGAIVWPD
jgi:hypothetical protein